RLAEEEDGSLSVVPASIQALLASRLDRLPPSQRRVLDRAAVLGRDFSTALVAHLLPLGLAGSFGPLLTALAAKGLIRPRSGAPRGAESSSHHVLIRDVAYAAIPKARRVDLHESAADWLENRADSS